MKFAKIGCAVLFSVLSSAAGSAMASSTVKLLVNSAGAYGYYKQDNITINGSTTTGAYAGGSLLTNSSQSLVSWCVDFYHDIYLGQTYTFNVGTTADMAKDGFTSGQINALQGLADNAYAKVTNQDSSAAFQLAVWAILYGNGSISEVPGASNAYKVTDGSSYAVSKLSQNIADLTYNFLTTLNDPSPNHYQITYLYDGIGCTKNCFQDQIVFTPSPVPLPATLPLMASGVGLLTLIGRRRKKR